MDLLKTIHQRWAAATALNNLLPATQVYTGTAADPTMPYAVVTQRSDRPDAYHHDGSALRTVGLRIEVVDDDLDDALAIVQEVKTAFERTDFDLSDNDRVLNIQRADEKHQHDGAWRLTVDLDCNVYLAGV